MKQVILGVTAFFTTAGRTSITRFLIIAVIAGAILWACFQTRGAYGLIANFLVGIVAGGALAKLLAESARRVRDTGRNLRVAAWVAASFGMIMVAGLMSLNDQIMGDIVTRTMTYVIPATAATFLLWPSRNLKEYASTPRSASGGLRLASACVLGGIIAATWLSWLTMGMRASIERNLEIESARDRLENAAR